MLRLPDLRPLLTVLLLMLALTLAGCRAPEWLGPESAVAWHPSPALIQSLRDSNDVCAGRPLARPTVRWFVVPGDGRFWSPAGEGTLGYWTGDHRIYVGDTLRTWVLRHELLHASLGKGHPAVFHTCKVMP